MKHFFLFFAENCSRLLPSEFEECYLRLFCRYKSQKDAVRTLFNEVKYTCFFYLFAAMYCIGTFNLISVLSFFKRRIRVTAILLAFSSFDESSFECINLRELNYFPLKGDGRNLLLPCSSSSFVEPMTFNSSFYSVISQWCKSQDFDFEKVLTPHRKRKSRDC